MRTAAAAWALGVLLLGAGALYVTRLSYVPPFLMQDEVNFALQAESIASSGHDTNGRLLPVYFSETGFEAGRDPAMIYWSAPLLMIRPLSDATARIPTASLGVVSIALIALAASRWFRSDVLALLAAAYLALTPGYFTNARLALSITYPIPVAIVWLWCVHRALSGQRRHWWAFAAGATLGFGVYTYLASMITMPLLLAATAAALVRNGGKRLLPQLAAGFGLLLLPLFVWTVMHPDRFAGILTAYQPGAVSAAKGLSAHFSVYWMFFSPDYLFISGDGRLTNSTRAAGLFPMAFAILIAIGIYRFARNEDGPLGWLTLAGVLIAPLPAAASGHLEINRVLLVIPFGVLAAIAGTRHLLQSTATARLVAAMLIASIGLQFASFYRDYVGPYRVTAGPRFGGNNRDAIMAVLDRATATTPIYLNRGTPIERYWKFYAVARGRRDLAEQPIYYEDSRQVMAAPRGALLICETGHAGCEPVTSDARWRLIASAPQPDGDVSHRVYVREP